MKDQRLSGDKTMTAKFDQWLEDELSRTLTPIVSQPARPGQARYQSVRSGRLSMSRKAMVGLAAATLAVAGSGVLAAASGSVNPQVWGQQVKSAVEQCEAELQPGAHEEVLAPTFPLHPAEPDLAVRDLLLERRAVGVASAEVRGDDAPQQRRSRHLNRTRR